MKSQHMYNQGSSEGTTQNQQSVLSRDSLSWAAERVCVCNDVIITC